MSGLVVGEDQKPLTRCGYPPHESLKQFETSLVESGTVAIGKAMHFSADIICSGGYTVWIRTIWDYVISHVGLASPRVFVYLAKRFKELDEMEKKYPSEELYKNTEFQTRIAEIVMVLREIPRRPKLVWPKVGPETHREGWIYKVSSAAETAAVQKVWKREGDLPVLRLAGNELLSAVKDGSTEKTLYWIRWILDEDASMKKENRGASLTTVHRGTGGGSDVGNYIAELFLEAYRDLARQSLIRMNEEFLCLIQLWRGQDARITPSGRKQILALLGQIVSEVPRWKVPAAPSLIKDPVQVSRAVNQSYKFFHEVLVYPRIAQTKQLEKLFKAKGPATAKPKDEKTLSMEDKIDAYDRVVNAYFNK